MIILLAMIAGAGFSACWVLDSHKWPFWVVMALTVVAVATIRGIR